MEPSAGASDRSQWGTWVLVLLVTFAVGFLGGRTFRRPAEILVDPPKAGGTFQPLVSNNGAVPAQNAPTEVAVHVVGQVAKPGLVRLPPGSRTEDAIRACGGPLPDADPESVNLAEPLVDGEQIRVQKKGVPPIEPLASNTAPPLSDSKTPRPLVSSSKQPSGRSGTAKPAPRMVSLNHASSADLESLPGVGPATAAKILEYRRAHGGFSSVDELLAVKGIGPKKLADIRPFVKL